MLKKFTLIFAAVAASCAAACLGGCYDAGEFSAKTATYSSAEVKSLVIEVTDREVEVLPSQDGGVDISYCESVNEFYDIALSPEGELMGRLRAGYADTEYHSAELVAGGDWTLLVQEGLVTAFGYEDGRIVHGHDYELPAVSFAQDYDYIYAYDGDRLCALAVGRSIGWYSGEPGYSEDTLLIAAVFYVMVRQPPRSTPLPHTTLFRSLIQLSLG